MNITTGQLVAGKNNFKNMQDNINNSINTNNLNNTNLNNTSLGNLNNNTNTGLNSISVPTSNLSGEITANKNSLYIKIFIFVILFLIIIGALTYILLPKNKTNINPVNNNSFPNLNLGTDISGETYTNNTNNLEVDPNGKIEEGDPDSVSHIWPKSITGYELISFTNGTNTENFVLFMDKLSGNIYKTLYPSLENIRLTNTTLQDISKAAFSKNADFVVVLIGNDLSYELAVSRLGSEPDQSFAESKIDQKVFDLMSSKTENIFYYLKNIDKNSVSILSFMPNTGKVTVLNTLNLTDIFISGEDKKNLYVSSKPSNNLKQLTVVINKKTGTLEYLKNADNNKYLLGGNIIKESSALVYLSNLDNYKNESELKLKSFADKCSLVRLTYLVCGVDEVISDEIRILDYWYSGKISFTDSLSFINTADGEKTFIPISLVSGEPLDIYNINTSNDYLTFQNKNDESLWLVDLVGL